MTSTQPALNVILLFVYCAKQLLQNDLQQQMFQSLSNNNQSKYCCVIYFSNIHVYISIERLCFVYLQSCKSSCHKVLWCFVVMKVEVCCRDYAFVPIALRSQNTETSWNPMAQLSHSMFSSGSYTKSSYLHCMLMSSLF